MAGKSKEQIKLEREEEERQLDGYGKELSDFMRELTRYQELARNRFPEYLNTHYSDATFEQRTLFEMMMEFSARLKKLESVMEPAPETEGKAKFY